MRLRRVRLERNRPPNKIHRKVVISRLMRYHPQKPHRTRMIRLSRKDLPIKPLRLPQPPSLMMPQRQIEDLLDRRIRHTPIFTDPKILSTAPKFSRRARSPLPCSRELARGFPPYHPR